jgi:hypothetical protein
MREFSRAAQGHPLPFESVANIVITPKQASVEREDVSGLARAVFI